MTDMGRKKVDVKIRYLIERCILSRERSLFLILNQTYRYQIAALYHIFLKARNQLNLPKPSILWCFKKDNGYNFICHKIRRLLKKKYSGNYSLSEEDCFDHFLSSVAIQFCHFNDTTSVLGQTFDMLVIQDFEALTPNILARIIECVQGGGVIMMLISSVQTVQEIPFIKMDAHSRYITPAYLDVDPVFNSRFMLSLNDCTNCIVLSDCQKILLCPSNLDSVDSSQTMVKNNMDCIIQSNSADLLDKVSSLCCTNDQNNALQIFISALKKKCARSVLALTSARGRGKSATLGLAASCALYLKHSCIYVTSPQIENLHTFFQFIVNGVKAFGYKEEKDFSIIYKVSENKKHISGINIFHDQMQTVKYLLPTEFYKVGTLDLIVIDEAAAIPLPVVKSWLKSDLVFMASTINGYEGTGRSLSLKLMSQLRNQSDGHSCKESSSSSKKSFSFHEITLNEAIRYADGDNVEAWLNRLFCLDTEINHWSGAAPNPEQCQLYYINKKVLFSYQKVAEKFLQQLVALFVSSHYKNSPNDLLMMADAPSHHLFCLLPPVEKKTKCLPNVLCVIQVALEGKISKDCVIQELSRGKRASGDLIPWIISQQFQDNNFPFLSGARVVRIATHPNLQRMGYGQQALRLLFSYYGKFSKEALSSTDAKNEDTTLFLGLEELHHNKLDYVGVSYGLTLELLKFWKKLDFVPLYLRQTASETTGEHSCIMIKCLNGTETAWLSEYLCDFYERFLTLLTSAFRNLSAFLALEILHYKRNNYSEVKDGFIGVTIHPILTACSIKRLEAYCNHLVDYHLIMDLIPVLARCYFLCYFRNFFLSAKQEVILLSMALQNKSVEEVAEEMNLETNQVMGLFMKIVKKICQHMGDLQKRFSQNKNLLACNNCDSKNQNSSFCEKIKFKRKNQNSYGKNKKNKIL